MSPRLAYRCSGGDLVAGGTQRMTLADARALWALHLDEIRAASRAGDAAAEVRATRLAAQLLGAVRAHVRWRRASRGVS